MNILITGGAGFIGSNASDHFAEKGWNVIILDNLLTGRGENICHLTENGKALFIEGDIRDDDLVGKIFREYRIDVCLNCAALVSVAESVSNPGLTESINTGGIINLLRQGGNAGIRVFVHASSAAVYGENPELPKREEMRPEPKSPYAVSKISGEYYNSYFASVFGFTPINCRFFNVFGSRQNPNSQYGAAIPTFIKCALTNEEITIFGDGKQTRDFIYVNDLVRAIDFLVDRAIHTPAIDFPVFNLGYGNFITINDLAGKIITLTNSNSKVRHEQPRPGDIKHSYSSTDKLWSLGWGSSAIGFEKGLAETIEWYRSTISR